MYRVCTCVCGYLFSVVTCVWCVFFCGGGGGGYLLAVVVTCVHSVYTCVRVPMCVYIRLEKSFRRRFVVYKSFYYYDDYNIIY